jgi:uncharacterized membrane protein (DUF485 family)
VAEPAETDGQGPAPAGEQVHLPGPTFLPAFLAFGLTLSVVGIVITWVLSVIGVVIVAATLTRWIRETREDIADLPLEH